MVGVSVDSAHSHLAWASTPRNRGGLGGCTFPLLGDTTRQMARAYGVLAADGPDAADAGPGPDPSTEAGRCLRGTFLLDPAGKLRHASVTDFAVGRSVDECLRLVKAFRFSDANGVVCPANWKPGGKALVADPEGAQSYFAEL